MQSETKTNFKQTILSNNRIQKFDSDEESKLELYCYDSCSNKDNQTLKQSRGLVFHGEDLVMQAFPYTDEYTTDSKELKEVFTESNFLNWSFFNSYEGTLLRLFNFKGKWYLSTHHKLNAFRSKWSSKDSFGTLFVNALKDRYLSSDTFRNFLGQNVTSDEVYNTFLSKLNTEFQYMFLVRNNNENRIVSVPPENTEPQVYHVGTYTVRDGEDNVTLDTDLSVGLTFSPSYTFKDLGDVLELVNKMDYKQFQGIIAYNDLDGRQVKILNPTYKDLSLVRGNEPSLKFRYLQLRLDADMKNKLYKLYPGMSSVFDDYENTLKSIAKTIHMAYLDRFINKKHTVVSQGQFAVIRICHEWHKTDRLRNKVNLSKIIEVLNTQTPTNLNHLIKEHKFEQVV
jgi:hypothetical protein